MSINNSGLTTKQPLLDSVNFTDVTPSNPIRGDLITAQGATPLWTRLPKGLANQVLTMDATATDIIWAAPAGGGGSGTVTSFSAGNLSPILTTSVATPTTTPALSFSLSNASAHSFLGNNTGGSAAPAYVQPNFTDLAGSVAAGQMPALTGDVTTSAGTVATTLATVATPGTNTKITFNAKGLVTSGAQASLASADFANQGTVTTVLHGNAAGNPSFAAVTSADTTGTFPSTPHTLLDGSVDSDTTAGTVARGDLITGQGASAKWTRLAKGTANQLLAMDGTGTDVVWAPPPGGTGTVTNVSGLTPLFTTSNPTTTPTFALSNAAANTVFGNNTSGSAAPGFQSLVKAQLPAVTMFTDASQTMSAGTIFGADTLIAKYWGGAPVFDATQYAGADPCAKILAVYSDAAYLAAAIAIVDATGFTGSQNCASNFLAITRPTWIKLGNVTLHVTVNLATPFSTGVLAAPATPTANATATTGGTLSNAVFVRTGYVTAWTNENSQQFGPSAELTVAMNAACAGTPTCTATINSPAAVVGAYGYNIFESNTTNTEKKCNGAPIPLGVTYKITANCGGSAVNTSNLVSYIAVNMLSGVGDNTQISLENAAASIDAVTNATWNWMFRDMSIISTLTTQSVNGMLQLGNSQQAENITFSGGGNHIYIVGSMVTVKKTRHYGFTQTTGPVAGITAFNTKWVRIEDTIFSNFTFPVSPTLNNGISLNQCTICTVDGVRSDNVDNSLAVNGGSMLVATGDGTAANASSHVIFTNFQCDSLINVNCADFLNFTHDSEMSNGTCRNTNNVAGLGANILGADCFDIFMAAHINLTNLIGNHRGGTGGVCCPTLEAYSVSDMTVNGCEFSDDQGNEGVRIVGSPAVTFNGVIASRNLNSGIVLADLSSTVTCNGTTTVAWVSGQPFGPWQPGTQVWIGAGPTAFNIASVTDFHTMILTTTCGLGASQAFAVYTQDTTINAAKLDDNGQAGTGTGVRTGLAEGIYVSGHSQVTINSGSANDNAPVLANKHQQYAARTENSARMVVNMMDGSGNGGGSNCLKVLKPMGATTEWFCDSSGLSPVLTTDGATNKIVSLTPVISNFGMNDQGQAATVADSSAINTTETIIVKTLAIPANRLVAGTHIRAILTGTCNSSVANTSTFTLRMGTLGTTGDTAIATPVTGVAGTGATAVPFRVTIDFTIRTIGASGTGFVTFTLESNGLTGIVAAQTPVIIMPTMSAFNTQTANNIISVSYKSAATTTTSTFKEGVIQFVNL